MDDFTSLDAASIAAHEMYQSLQRAGFTKDEALSIITGAMKSEASVLREIYEDSKRTEHDN